MSCYILEKRLLYANILRKTGLEGAVEGDLREQMVCLCICGAMLGARAVQTP
jgi:hypothetical protein